MPIDTPNSTSLNKTKKIHFSCGLILPLEWSSLWTAGNDRWGEVSNSGWQSGIYRFDTKSILTVSCRVVSTLTITAEVPRSNSWNPNYTESTSVLAEISREMYSGEAAYVSFQFQQVKHPKSPKAFGSTIHFFVQSLNVSIVIRTICVLTGRIEDKELW